MLDNETKRRIDTARDILVGKVPDPKSQVEQITIALIYKFMDDMDKEAVSFGGKATFFTGEYEQYSWTNIFDTKVGGHEMLSLYSEAIVKLNLNPNIPQLFRDIFKNAYLPYRDPETLKLFLKTINEFHYDHSEKLGDAFEYLLSVLGSQGDAGQFRTPRHIIDFIVEIVQPKKTETILDPACGTAGFLISSYKHILQANSKKYKGDLLTPDDRKKLMQNFVGYDISPDMVRLSLVNMYLHGFITPNIYEYDTLTSEDRWTEYFDVVIANPPFMSPKGGIKPHKKFTIQANRSEVLFVDYIAEHIHPSTGRAGIIVPEGIIFQSATAYKTLRKMLVDKNYLYAVVSLPAGVFNPYSGVKTSILLMDKGIAKKTDNILFVKIENDGFDLGAQRREIDKNDLPEALTILQQYKEALENKQEFASDNKNVLLVEKKKIGERDDFNLSFDRYRISENINHSEYEMVRLCDVCEINPKKSEVKCLPDDTLVSFVPMADINENSMDFTPKEEKKLVDVVGGYTYFRDNDVLVAKVTPCFENGKAGVAKNLKNGIGFGSSELYVLRCSEKVLPSFIYMMLTTEKFKAEGTAQMTGTGGLQRVPKDFVSEFQIPLPPISVQQRLSNNAAYQKIIDGAKQVVENYKPQIEIKPEWKLVELKDVCDVNPQNVLPNEVSDNGEFIYLDISSVENGTGIYSLLNTIKVEEAPSRARREIKDNDVLLSTVRPNLKAFAFLKNIPKSAIASTGFAVLRCKKNITPKFIYELLFTDFLQEQMISKMGKGSYPSINQTDVEYLQIPLPSSEEQNAIVKQIEQEQEIINGNKKLILLYEKKIKDEINKLWKQEPMEYALSEEKISIAAEE